MTHAIEINQLAKRYGRHIAIYGLNLRVATGETYALLGPNGAGKTTTVEILEGLRAADTGSVTVLGLDPIRDRIALQKRIGVMLQEGGIYQGAKAREVLDLFASYYPSPRPTDELLELVGLQELSATVYRNMSGGEKQRLSLALALTHRPELVFLDEPTAGMDPSARKVTWAIIEQLQEEGVTLLLTTHYMEEAERLADRVGIVNRGRLVAEGSPAALIHARGDVSFSSRNGLPVDRFRPETGVGIQETRPGHYIASTDKPTPVLVAEITKWLADHDALLTELRVGAGGLEEVFLDLTEEDG